MIEKCKLCDKKRELIMSHIIPDFVFKWGKKHGTGFFRNSDNPNRRVQDGIKEYLLCDGCEQKLAVWENQFAELFFKPIHTEPIFPLKYSEWLYYFSVSISWRNLLYHKNHNGLSFLSNEQRKLSEEAFKTWLSVLQNSRNINEKFHQYILSVDQIKSFPVEIKLSPYINRYLFKTSDFDLIKTENTCLVFTKMYKIIIIGIIQQPDKIFLNGTQVEFSSGEFNPHGIAIPTDILAYINSKANKAAESLYSMSNNQKEVISSTYMENLEKYRNSDMIKATEADFHNSSKAAFDMLKNINEELND